MTTTDTPQAALERLAAVVKPEPIGPVDEASAAGKLAQILRAGPEPSRG